MSENDRSVVVGMTQLSSDQPVERKELMEKIGFSSSMMNRYQARLKEKGVIKADGRNSGKYEFALPLFDDFVRDYHMDE